MQFLQGHRVHPVASIPSRANSRNWLTLVTYSADIQSRLDIQLRSISQLRLCNNKSKYYMIDTQTYDLQKTPKHSLQGNGPTHLA